MTKTRLRYSDDGRPRSRDCHRLCGKTAFSGGSSSNSSSSGRSIGRRDPFLAATTTTTGTMSYQQYMNMGERRRRPRRPSEGLEWWRPFVGIGERSFRRRRRQFGAESDGKCGFGTMAAATAMGSKMAAAAILDRRLFSGVEAPI